MPFAYVLYSNKLNKYYVGSTIDVAQRIQRHNRGGEKFTSRGIPWIVVYTEKFNTIQEAKKRDWKLKEKRAVFILSRL